MILGPIPCSKIKEYGYEAGLDPDMMELFEIVILAMDSAYRDWSNAEQKKARERNPKEPKST